ncbi:hypothetical protein RBE51_17985 [Pseudomonas taiwanensis]|uniref:hypothetical protein n=1 Tax=Pseudomonas taiwanensis TaxID=470150 RepID=UPI0028DDF296|nr:hypothetical protein [Pseudomonas taiwanensis]MDT8924702.1 hypothetical protein [Pseudomonas taiwanensis]
MIRTGMALAELPGLIHPEMLARQLQPQTPREEALVDLIEELLLFDDSVDRNDSIDCDELERLKGLEVKFTKGNAAFKAGLEELKLLLCQVSTDHEKVAHMTEWLFRQRATLTQLAP